MSDSQAARKYLTPDAESFWEWSDDGKTVVWTGGWTITVGNQANSGSTITFVEELHALLGRFLVTGLPPFDSFLLIIAATRASFKEESRNRLWERLVPEKLFTNFNQLKVLDALNVIHERSELWQSPDSLASLLFYLLGDEPPAIGLQESRAVLNFLARGLDEEMIQGVPLRTKRLEELAPVLIRMGEKATSLASPEIQDRIATGVDFLPEADDDLELPIPDKVRSLLRKLSDEEGDLAGIAHAAKHLMSIVSLPRRLALDDKMPIGGVSDITNRGPLDRLLLSELAHDDLTLAVRVAVNEAMYLRRESPPESPPQNRTILLDGGIRAWGVPRIYIVATALAILSRADPRGALTVRSLSNVSNTFDLVDLTTSAGLTEHLKGLTPVLHPGKALADWHAEARDHVPDELLDPVLVTTRDVLDDLDFRQRLRELEIDRMFLAVVDHSGDFELIQRTKAGLKSLKKAKLNLDEISKSNRDASPLLDPSISEKLPAIYRLKKFPLRLSERLSSARAWAVEDVGAFLVTLDGRLLFFENKRRGGEQLLDAKLGSAVFWSSKRAIRGMLYAVLGTPPSSCFQVVTINARTREARCDDINFESAPQGFCDHDGQLFAVCPGEVYPINLDPVGYERSTSIPNNLRWKHEYRGRIFSADNPHGKPVDWFCLSSGSMEPRFEEVSSTDGSVFEHVFEHINHEGFLAVRPDGSVVEADTGKSWLGSNKLSECQLGRFLAVSQCGSYVTFASSDAEIAARRLNARKRVKPSYAVIHIEPGKESKLLGKDPEPFWLGEGKAIKRRIRMLPLRKRFIAVGISDYGLTLSPHQHQKFYLHEENGRLKITKYAGYLPEHPRVNFKPKQIAGSNSELRVASFDGGSKITLDSRGLLHVKSSDPSIPEATIVLHDLVAGWISTGEYFGHEYFLPENANVVPVSELFSKVLNPFIERCENDQLALRA